MFCRFIHVSLSCLLIPLILSCGPQQGATAGTGRLISHGESLGELAYLVERHPALGRASLREIKMAASGPDRKDVRRLSSVGLHSVGSRSMAMRPMPEEREVDPVGRGVIAHGLAMKAEVLIEDVLDSIEFLADWKAMIKTMGISLNAELHSLEAYGGLKGSLGDKGIGAKELLSCEEFVNRSSDPDLEHMIEEISLLNKENLKSSISGCSSIKAQEFLTCVNAWNAGTEAINMYATCDMKSMLELSRMIKEKTGKSLIKMAKGIDDCTEHHFKNCGFLKKKPQHIREMPHRSEWMLR